MNMIERVARALCVADGYDPDTLNPGDARGVDGYMPNGDPAHRLWRAWEGKARAAIEAMRAVEPTTAMMEAMWSMNFANTKESFALCWQAMIDAALEEGK